MELELGQLDLRYGSLCAREKCGEKQAVSAVSMERTGPVVVVLEGDRWAVVEGFATVRARHRLKHDTVEATVWETGSAQGLALRERLRRGRRLSAVEEGWLVTYLAQTEGWSPEEIGHWTGRPPGWVRSRQEAVKQLPDAVQERVRRGEIDAAVASGPLLSLSRSSQRASERLGDAIAGKGLSRPQVSYVVDAWRRAAAEGRERLLANPVLYVKARQAHPGGQELLKNSRALLASARRLETEMSGVDEASHRRVQGILKETLGVLERMLGQEGGESASTQAACGDPGAVGQGAQRQADRQGAEGLAAIGQEGGRLQDGDGAAAIAAVAAGGTPGGDRGADQEVQGQPGESARGTDGAGHRGLLPGAHGIRTEPGAATQAAGRSVRVCAGLRDAARHVSPRHSDQWPDLADADGVGGALLQPQALLPALLPLHPLRGEGLPDRGVSVLRGGSGADHGR